MVILEFLRYSIPPRPARPDRPYDNTGLRVVVVLDLESGQSVTAVHINKDPDPTSTISFLSVGQRSTRHEIVTMTNLVLLPVTSRDSPRPRLHQSMRSLLAPTAANPLHPWRSPTGRGESHARSGGCAVRVRPLELYLSGATVSDGAAVWMRLWASACRRSRKMSSSMELATRKR